MRSDAASFPYRTFAVSRTRETGGEGGGGAAMRVRGLPSTTVTVDVDGLDSSYIFVTS